MASTTELQQTQYTKEIAMTAKNHAVNYTPEQVAVIVDGFKAGTPTVDLANAVGKSVRSVIAKLSREGVYVAKNKTEAGGAPRTTKSDMIAEMAQIVAVEPEVLASLEKASKEALEIVLASLRG